MTHLRCLADLHLHGAISFLPGRRVVMLLAICMIIIRLREKAP